MTTSRKCRAKGGVAACKSPTCPEKGALRQDYLNGTATAGQLATALLDIPTYDADVAPLIEQAVAANREGRLDPYLQTISMEDAYDLYHASAELDDRIFEDAKLKPLLAQDLGWIAISAKARSQGHF